MSHTKGKLQTCGLYAANEQGRAVFDCGLIPMEEEEIRANTRRIVACWNLLLPFTTEEIEAGMDLEKMVRENAALKAVIEQSTERTLKNADTAINNMLAVDKHIKYLNDEIELLKAENEKLREAIQNFLDTCEATNPLINGPTFVAIDALHAVLEES